MEITTESRGDDVVLITLRGRLDLVQAPGLRGAIDRLVEGGARHVVCDLSGVTFIDSSGLGALIGGLKRARQSDGELRIAAAGPQVLTVLRLTRLERVLRAYDSVEDALERL